jgi:hypothetical protein
MIWNLFQSRRTKTLRPAPCHIRPHRLVLEELEERRLLSTFTWVPNASGDFNTAANWLNQSTSTAGVPGAGDDAVVSITGINITSSTTNTVNSILCGAQLTITSGTFTIALGKNSHINTLVVNAGTALQANAGSPNATLFISGGTSSGTLAAAAGATITFGNNQFSMNGGSLLTGAGLFLVGGGMLTFNVNENAPANFQVDGGAVNGPGVLTITDTFTWSGGNLDGTSTTLVPAGTTLNITGSNHFKYVTGGHILNIAGTATWTGTGELDGSPGSTINNSGIFNVQTDAVSGNGGAGAGVIFNNSGTFTKSGTTGTTAFQGNVFNNSGTVNVLSGTLSFDSNYTQTAGTTVVAAGATLASSGTVNIKAGTLTGLGTVSADVSNAGTLGTGTSTGTLTITRTFTQTAGGTLNIKIGGSNQFDTIAVGGAATLGGTLNVSLINNFTPTAGLAFKILTFASVSGGFATENGLTISPNLSFNPVFDPADLTLVVTAPSPGVLQFSTGTYTANVTSGAATITVTRNNGSQGTVNVGYATSDGSAMAGVSYTTASGTLTFAAGVTSQSFTIPILSGAAGRGNQTVNLTISAPTGGATLGSPTTAVLTLIDNTQNVQAGQLQFTTNAYVATVTGGSATITVTRTNGSTGTVTVQYATSDGTAQAGVRYSATSGTLTFANGVTTQSFSIPILNPRTVQGNQTVNLTLSTVTGLATLGTPASAVLTIVDNNVGDDVAFISGLYHDVLGRAADAGGLAAFQLTVDAARNPVHLQFAFAYVTSTENRSDFVASAYTKYLGRTPSMGEVAGWVGVLQQGQTPEQVTTDFVSSLEYFQKQGGTNSSWLDHVYQDLLGRSRDPGSQGFLDQLTAGTGLTVVATELVGSTEYRTRLITQVYTTYLQRQPGSADLQAWLPLVGQPSAGPGQPSPDEQFLAGVIASIEYFQTSGNTELTWASSLYTKLLGRNPSQAELTNLLVAVLNGYQAARQSITSAIAGSTEAETAVVAGYYTQFLGRTASPNELSPWVSLLQSGGSREQVIAAIVGSPEYFQRQGGTNTQFVNQLYQDLLGRPRDVSESGFLNALNGGTATPLQVATVILQSTEYAQHLVNGFYSTMLGRQGSATETSGWVQLLTQGTHDEQVLAMILSSGEYFERPHTYP